MRVPHTLKGNENGVVCPGRGLFGVRKPCLRLPSTKPCFVVAAGRGLSHRAT